MKRLSTILAAAVLSIASFTAGFVWPHDNMATPARAATAAAAQPTPKFGVRYQLPELLTEPLPQVIFVKG